MPVDTGMPISKQRTREIMKAAKRASEKSQTCYVPAPPNFANWPKEEQWLFVVELNRLGRIRAFIRCDDERNNPKTE